MAGGIDWFRWHHGSVTDQKFPLIARKAGASVAEVIAVWACLLEAASMNAELRGHIGGEPDFEAIDCALGMDDGRARAIYLAMTGRGLVDDCGHISAWPTRQPKREREDTTNADRQATFKAKKNQVTPDNASDNQKTPREEKRREEKKEEQEHTESIPSKVSTSDAGRVCRLMKSKGISDVSPGNPDLVMLIEAGATDDEFSHAAEVAVKAGKRFAYALGVVKGKRTEAAEASKKIHRGPMPRGSPKGSYVDQQRAQLAALTGARTHQGDVIDV